MQRSAYTCTYIGLAFQWLEHVTSKQTAAMAFCVLVSLHVVLLFKLVHSATLTECPREMTVDLHSIQPSCSTQDNTCSSLQSAIDMLSTSPPEDNCTLVQLPPGTHYIDVPRLLTTGVHLRGMADNVTISCTYNRSNVMEDYSWYFSHPRVVMFEGLNFEGCPLPIRINAAGTVDIHNCLFRYFTEAVLDIYNCQSIFLTNSTFLDNTGSGISNYAYRGNTGAVSIGFNNVPADISFPNVLVSSCNFTNNSATAHSVFRTPSEAFSSQIFSGRGGALGVYINESFYNLSVEISDCRFERNFARSFGAGMYLLFNGFSTQHTITVERTYLISNMAGVGGGGTQLSYISNGIVGSPHMANFTDCRFEGNRGDAGGGIYVYPSFTGGDGNFVKMERCYFTGNRGVSTRNDYGGAVALSLLSLLRQKETLPRHEIVDCTFVRNSGTNGIVSVGYTPLLFKGTNRFIENSGTSALRVVGTVVDLFDTMEFINNTVTEDEAALHILSFGQIRLQKGLDIAFMGNVGRFGAGILIDTPTSSIAFDRLLFNTQCFALYSDLTAPPSMWNDVTIRFRENTAVLASSLLVSRLGPCSWFSLAPPYFNDSYILEWPLWDFGNDSVNTGYTDPLNTGYYVETAAEHLISSTTSVARWPGFRFPLDLSGVDELDRLTTVTARLAFTPPPEATYTVNFLPEIVIVDSDSETGILTQNFTLTYSITSATHLQLNKSLGHVAIEDPFETVQVSNDSFVLYPLPCPGGYALTPTHGVQGSLTCQCKNNVSQVIHCEDDQDTVVIESGYWAAFTPSISGSNLEFYPCPPGYCRCTQASSIGNTTCVYTFTNTDPDRQCACTREGVLCGGCRGDVGVSALLNRCVPCHDASAMLIVGLVIADAIVFTVIVLLDLPLPSWTYPFIFYVQLAPYVTSYFPESFETVGEYLLFAGSATGFYFVYDFCLYGNMSALVSYTIRYLPLLVALLLCPVVVLLRKCRLRLLRHHGLWWILLLLYSHLVHTSISILNCPMLRDPSDQSISPRWFIDGEVHCFTGGHLPLALLAMAVLFLCFLLIPLTIIVSSLKPAKAPRLLRHFVHPLTAVFKEELKWWSGVELARRFLFLLFFIPFPRNAASPTLVLAFIITVYGFVQPYKSLIANILEMGVQINFLLLLLIEATSDIHDVYFTFPPILQSNVTSQGECLDSQTGIAAITWILMPFYYLPLLVFAVIAGVYSALYIRKKFFMRSSNDSEPESPQYNQYTHTEVFLQSLRRPRSESSESGFIVLTNISNISEETDTGETF